MSANGMLRPDVRVLYLSDGSLLSSGIETLLHQQTTLHTTRSDSSLDEILDCIHTFRPDIVIHRTEDRPSETAANWLQILKDMTGIRLIELSLMHNSICIFHGQTQILEKDTDLLLAIQKAME